MLYPIHWGSYLDCERFQTECRGKEGCLCAVYRFPCLTIKMYLILYVVAGLRFGTARVPPGQRVEPYVRRSLYWAGLSSSLGCDQFREIDRNTAGCPCKHHMWRIKSCLTRRYNGVTSTRSSTLTNYHRMETLLSPAVTLSRGKGDEPIKNERVAERLCLGSASVAIRIYKSFSLRAG